MMIHLEQSGYGVLTAAVRGGVDGGAAKSARIMGGEVRLSHLSRVYDGFRAVNDLNLNVSPGEFLTLLGASGSGKTTTLMMVAGFVDPSEGDILINGRSIV